MNLKIVKENPITMSELKTELAKIKKRDEELNFRANKTEDYLNQFDVLSKAKADELRKKLEGLGIARLNETIIVKLVDILPTNPEDLKVVMQGMNVSLTQADLKKVTDSVAEVVK